MVNNSDNLKGDIMETCKLCGKLKKRKKVKYCVFSYDIISENEIIKINGFLCKKCIKKLKRIYYPF